MSMPVLEYVGFQNTLNRREYLLRIRSGADQLDYTVGIAHGAFTSGRARYQDGPGICYEKLLRELAAEAAGAHDFDVSDAELKAYQEAHSSPQKRRWTSPVLPGATAPAARPGGVRS